MPVVHSFKHYDQNKQVLLSISCAHLITSICSKSIVVVFHFYFDVVCGALFTPAKALEVMK